MRIKVFVNDNEDVMVLEVSSVASADDAFLVVYDNEDESFVLYPTEVNRSYLNTCLDYLLKDGYYNFTATNANMQPLWYPADYIPNAEVDDELTEEELEAFNNGERNAEQMARTAFEMLKKEQENHNEEI